jgi:hypothetical protein
MATRARTTFQKRQKEMARKDKQQRKAERREQRKLDRESGDGYQPTDDPMPADAKAAQGQVISRHRTTEN